MKLTVSDSSKTKDVVKRAFYLAWVACGGPLGLGFLQNKPGASEDDVWKNVCTDGDYAGNLRGNKVEDGKGEVYGDYVFGRMMKTGIKWDGDAITVRDETPRHDYQAWCRKYPTYDAIVREAATQLGVTLS